MTGYEQSLLIKMINALEAQEKTSQKILWELTHIREKMAADRVHEKRCTAGG